MKIVGKINSYNKATNTDCFGNKGASSIDHIWPKEKDGALSQENTQLLTLKSNNEKASKNKDKINGIRFAVNEIGRTPNRKIIGQMYIQKANGWLEVIPIR